MDDYKYHIGITPRPTPRPRLGKYGAYNKSDYTKYKNDMIFEQPRENLIQQEFISYEVAQAGEANVLKRITITRKYDKFGGYTDQSSSEILG